MTTVPAIDQDQPLPDLYWAALCSIMQEPQYQFTYDEAKLAKAMAKDGLLEPLEKKRYTITAYGQQCYEAELLLAKPGGTDGPDTKTA